jgi:predicted nucleotidyltransferase
VTTFEVLTATEHACLERYVDVLRDTLGDGLVRIAVFGSVARNERWPVGMPIRSDLDLLVVVRAPLAAEVEEALINATLPLFLESGRQIGPQFRTAEQAAASTAFVDAIEIWPCR